MLPLRTLAVTPLAGDDALFVWQPVIAAAALVNVEILPVCD